MQQTNHAQQNRLGRLHRGPALRGGFVAVLVVLGRMQDRDAQEARGIDVRVEGDGCFEGEGRWQEGVGWWEGEVATEIASYVESRTSAC